ncbi:unnamed protein product [Ilex paraguariensis]|uniref:Uncharacterized protein n=1 Tax=Ilex paraguariensis TaxID=185542 RepID=A0ABC8SHD4_9AQUA
MSMVPSAVSRQNCVACLCLLPHHYTSPVSIQFVLFASLCRLPLDSAILPCNVVCLELSMRWDAEVFSSVLNDYHKLLYLVASPWILDMLNWHKYLISLTNLLAEFTLSAF